MEVRHRQGEAPEMLIDGKWMRGLFITETEYFALTAEVTRLGEARDDDALIINNQGKRIREQNAEITRLKRIEEAYRVIKDAYDCSKLNKIACDKCDTQRSCPAHKRAREALEGEV